MVQISRRLFKVKYVHKTNLTAACTKKGYSYYMSLKSSFDSPNKDKNIEKIVLEN